MNEIVRNSDAKGTRKNSTVSVELIKAVQSKFARQELWWVSSRLHTCLTEPTDRISESHLREVLAAGEAALANGQAQWLVAELKSKWVLATSADIRRELGMLLLAFPTKDDLSAFMEIAIAEIASEPLSRLQLAIACRELRRTARFRPSIAEILEALSDVSLHHVADLIKLPKRVEAVRQRLAKGDFQQPVAQARITHGHPIGDDSADPGNWRMSDD
jgi:hypothetical protein